MDQHVAPDGQIEGRLIDEVFCDTFMKFNVRVAIVATRESLGFLSFSKFEQGQQSVPKYRLHELPVVFQHGRLAGVGLCPARTGRSVRTITYVYPRWEWCCPCTITRYFGKGKIRFMPASYLGRRPALHHPRKTLNSRVCRLGSGTRSHGSRAA